MILGSDNRKKWSALDVLVMQAYQILDNERCQECGHYRWLCLNNSPDLQLKIVRSHCYVKGEIDAEQKKNKSGDYDGELRGEFYTRSGASLHTFRKAYYEALAAESEDDED
jgi:hypothetical protein